MTALTDSAGAGEHLQAALRRVRSVAADTGVAGVVLTAPGPVAWVTGGLNQPIDRTAAVDVVWLAVSADGAFREYVSRLKKTKYPRAAMPGGSGPSTVTRLLS